MKRAFTSIIDNLKTTIVDYEYYVNFEKIYYQVWNYLVELNILNLLIGSKNIEEDFIKIINDYPKVISVLPLLLAVTKFDIPVIDHYLITYNFKTKSMSNNEYVNFMKKTKLFDLFENNKIKNLVDYVTGIVVGLDSHARKNRTGFIMEKIVENFIKKTNYVDFFKQIKKIDIANKYGIDINKLLVDKNNKEAEKNLILLLKQKSVYF
ncbi:DpnII family type II restriction endonuclease [Spiroplasma sp. AdecLV25b]|uniref:DpnII family type II restriction endonuclease n=1 Tax=Spiroplasma sp. AdecLV25b TaxID=3027162 RepID=UPI0027E0C8CC|nr:DpnII family type II restriction endonuclease [Spiroplasma sp. AdecLV25b]